MASGDYKLVSDRSGSLSSSSGDETDSRSPRKRKFLMKICLIIPMHNFSLYTSVFYLIPVCLALFLNSSWSLKRNLIIFTINKINVKFEPIVHRTPY